MNHPEDRGIYAKILTPVCWYLYARFVRMLLAVLRRLLSLTFGTTPGRLSWDIPVIYSPLLSMSRRNCPSNIK